MVPKTPQPAKKAKVDAKEPKSAPAKMQKGACLSQLLIPGARLRIFYPVLELELQMSRTLR